MSNIKGGAFLRINSNYGRLFPTEKRIADFILENSNQMETISNWGDRAVYQFEQSHGHTFL